MLAAMSPGEWPSVIEDKRDLAMRELGWVGIRSSVFLLQYARILAEDILADRIDSLVGSAEMYGLLQETDGDSELGAWYDIDELMLAQSDFRRSGKKDPYYYVEPDELVRVIKQACSDLLHRTRRKFGLLPDTTFREAEETFKEFLADNDHLAEVLWLFAEDVTIRQNTILIRPLDRKRNHALTEVLYERGKERKHGIEMHAFAKTDGDICAYIVVPLNDLHAQSRLMGSDFIKFSARLPLRNAEIVTSSPLLFLRNLFSAEDKRNGWEDCMPSLDDLG